jgi:uncharacterized protein YifN (PemK superfamily)
MIEELEGFPEYAKKFYKNIKSNYEDSYEGSVIAWEATKRRLRSEDGFLVANSEDFGRDRFVFQLNQPEKELVVNSEGDEVVIDAVLATTDKNPKGQFFTETELQQIAEQINSRGSVLPSTTHDDLQRLASQYGYSPQLITNALRNKRGFFNKIKAWVKDKKLWIQARLDKAYREMAESMKSLSIEVLGDGDGTGRIRNPNYMSFIFTDTPALRGADIQSVQ